jgi:hypothetical protein
MPLATTADVKRWLKDPTVKEEDLASWLEVAEERVRDYTGLAFADEDEELTETFTNVRQGSILNMRDRNPTDVVITAYLTSDLEELGSEVIEGVGYQMLERGRVQLIYSRYESDVGLGGGTVERQPGYYVRVVVAYVASGVIPASVREACACWAAHMYKTSGMATSGLSSERLGDYSYSVNASESGVPEAVRQLLGSYCQSRIRST